MSLARFVVWAPRRSSVTLMIKKLDETTPVQVAMTRDEDGWWFPAEPLPEDGVGEFDHGFILDDSDTVLPDPRSRRQPNDAIPGLSTQILEGTLKSPNVKEYTLGFGAALSTKGFAKIDFIHDKCLRILAYK